MDWRVSSPFSSVSVCIWLRNIMVLIVASGRGRQRQANVTGNRVVVRIKPKEPLPSAALRLWSHSSVRGVVLLTVILSGACLFRTVECAGAGELRVQNYAILSHVHTWGSPCDEENTPSDTERPRTNGAGEGTLKLSELVTQSDVIFKAFAGHGNDLREVALNHSAAGHREQQQQQQHHHQPRWKPPGSADFIVRLEPGTVYKGNELFKQLQLNSWKHYFILWSNGSAEYTHRGGPVQGRPGHHHTPPTEGATRLDDADAAEASGNLIRRNAPNTDHGRNRRPNCTALWHLLRRTRSTQPAVTEVDTGDSSYGQPQRNETGDLRTTTSSTADVRTDDDSIEPTTGNLGSGLRAPEQNGGMPSTPYAGGTTSPNERVYLPNNVKSTIERGGIAGGPPVKTKRTVSKSMEKDLKTEGQISRTLNEILPVTLIVFGRISSPPGTNGGDNLLRVDPYVGLLRWDDRLEDALWQALGWSKWGDYTGCSVACGKGVQQRFRHCLQSASRDRAKPGIRSETVISASVRTPVKRSLLNGEIENHLTNPPTETTPDETPVDGFEDGSRTQPVPRSAQPGVSMTSALPGVSILTPSGNGGKSKRKPKSQQTTATSENGSSHGSGNEKGIMNPTTNGPISSEGVTWTEFHSTFHEQQQQHMEPAAPMVRSERTGSVTEEGTWPSCEGHNIEQRTCNMFDCTGTIDLLTGLTPTYHWRTWDEGIDDRINYEINQLEQNFTLMISLRLKPSIPNEGSGHPGRSADRGVPFPHVSTGPDTGGHILSVRSKLTTGSSLSINFETDGHGGLRVLQEKYGLSEMLPVRSAERTLLDGDWHTLALSGRNGGFVTVYIDCQWINSFVLTKGSIELPQYPTIEIGHNVEVRQLTVVPGNKSARLQCNSQPVPIRDVENRRVTNYFEHLN